MAKPLTDRLPFLGGSLLPQPYDLIDEEYVFDNACLSGCLPYAGELPGLHPLQAVWPIAGYPGYQVVTAVACLSFLVGFLGVAPARARVVVSGL